MLTMTIYVRYEALDISILKNVTEIVGATYFTLQFLPLDHQSKIW